MTAELGRFNEAATASTWGQTGLGLGLGGSGAGSASFAYEAMVAWSRGLRLWLEAGLELVCEQVRELGCDLGCDQWLDALT